MRAKPKLLQFEESRTGLRLTAKGLVIRSAAGAGKGVFSGLVAGIVVGIGARVAMRIVALTAGIRPEFTIGGTLLILVSTAAFGMMLGLIFVAVRRWLPGSGLWKGLAFGLFLVLFIGVPYILDGISDPDGELREGHHYSLGSVFSYRFSSTMVSSRRWSQSGWTNAGTEATTVRM